MKKILSSTLCALLSLICTSVYAQGDTLSGSNCNLSAFYTYSTNPNGVTTFTGQYSGANGQPTFSWLVNGNYVGNNQSTYAATLPAGTEVCFEVNEYIFIYDSLQQTTDVDTCFAAYCDIISGSDTTSGTGCNLSAAYTYSTNPNGVTTFTGQYSGANGQPTFSWLVNGNYVGNNQSTYTATLPSGTEVCFEVTDYTFIYDSLQQTTDVDTCFAVYCEVIGTAGLTTGTVSEIQLYPNPVSQTLFISTSAFMQIGEIVVVDLNGRILMESKQVDQLDVSSLNQGVYYVKMKDTSGNWLTGAHRFTKE